MTIQIPNPGVSVLQPWVMTLPLREQGTLLTGVRGCDLAPKLAECIDERYGCSTGEGTAERALVAFFRYCILVPADPRELSVFGAFIRTSPPKDWKPSQFGNYPMHWYGHLMHGYEVVGYRHPDAQIASTALSIYTRLVRALHLNVETKEEFVLRCSEDRMASGEVVS